MRRNWSIRSKIISLIAVPIAALLALWIFATTLTLGPARALLNAQALLDDVGKPAEALVAELQVERRLSLVYLAGRGESGTLGDQRTRTDLAATEYRRRSAEADTGPLLAQRLGQLNTALDALPSARGFIDRREVDRTGARNLYTETIDAAFRAFGSLATLPDEDLNRQARTITALGRAREVLAQSDALLAGVFTAGRFGPGEHGQLVQIFGVETFLYTSAVADLPAAERAAYQRLVNGEAFTRLREMQTTIIADGSAGAAAPVDPAAWQSAYGVAQQSLRDFELTAADELVDRSIPVAVGILVRLALAGVVGLLAVVVAVYISVRVGRNFIRRLGGLRAAALDLAGVRLPDVVARLRRGDRVDVAREAPPLDFGEDELGQVGQAFGEVQRTAVASAVDEATLRRGLSEVFLNIARRSQTLLHRQIALLDKMERRTTDPDELADLFRIDHMATRMRRHAEDLVVLAGAAPGRGWRVPVPMVDVLRGAISEVEDYPRVSIMAIEPAAVVGRAVGDVIHLLAELLENATAYSPPHTRVQVNGQVVPNGYALEIEDRGLGMLPPAIEEANRRLADPPDFDPANSAQLGLFVVAQLAHRHGIRVQLRPSPYGGVTAVALLPGALVVAGAGTRALPGRAATGEPTGGRTAIGADGPRPSSVLVASAPTGGADPLWTVEGPSWNSPTPDRLPTVDSQPSDAVLGDIARALGGGAIPLGGAAAPRDSAAALRDSAAVPRDSAAAPRDGAGGGTGRPDAASAVRPRRPRSATAPSGPTRATGPPRPASDATGPTRSASDATGPTRPARPAPEATGPTGPTRPTPDEAGVGDDGLPRRVRQRSLAPQLRRPPDEAGHRAGPPTGGLAAAFGGSTAFGDHATGSGDAAPGDRTPEEIRARMSALQAGTARGRQAGSTGKVPPPETGDTGGDA